MGNLDSDPVGFVYGDQAWISTEPNHRIWNKEGQNCDVGAYDHGSRQMDCLFRRPAV